MNGSEPVVFIVDDEASVRKALTRLLNSAGFTVEGFGSGAEFLARLPYDGVGCIILDLRMPGADGLELQQRIANASCALPIIFVTGHGDIPASVRAIKAGAVDFLQKPFNDTQLLAAIENGLQLCRHNVKEHAYLSEIRKRYAKLTPRESEVLAGVIAGRLNKQIAADLGTVEKTVKVHRARVMRKMQAQSVPELVRMANRLGLMLPHISPQVLGRVHEPAPARLRVNSQPQ